MRVLALDVGEKRIGVAVSDPDGRVATALAVIDTTSATRDGRELTRLVDEYEIERVVVGLPLSLDGTEGPQARRVRTLADRLARFLRVPVEFADERLSSAEAKRRMREAGVSERQQRGSVDKVAAAVFLQTYLDSRVGPGTEKDGD